MKRLTIELLKRAIKIAQHAAYNGSVRIVKDINGNMHIMEDVSGNEWYQGGETLYTINTNPYEGIGTLKDNLTDARKELKI